MREKEENCSARPLRPVYRSRCCRQPWSTVLVRAVALRADTNLTLNHLTLYPRPLAPTVECVRRAGSADLDHNVQRGAHEGQARWEVSPTFLNPVYLQLV